MNFEWSEEQKRLYQDTLTFAREELLDDIVRRDLECRFARDLWRRCADRGILGWRLPAEFGGANHPVPTVALLMEALGRGCPDNGLTFALGAQIWGLQSVLLEFGSEDQRAAILPGSGAGTRIGAYAMNEKGSGSDAFALETTAVRDGGGWVLRGEKVLVTFAPIADYAVVFARTDPDAGRWGLSAFVVDAETPGYTAHPDEPKMGLRTVPFGRITLDDCRVPADALLGAEGSGAMVFSRSQAWERSLILAPQVGAMERLLDECVGFARDRSRGGAPIGSHQAVSHRIADMKLRLETARLLQYRAAWRLGRAEPTLMEAALTKAHLSETFADSARDAIAIFGGSGYLSETGVERNLRDALGATLYGGTTDIQRNIVSGLLGV